MYFFLSQGEETILSIVASHSVYGIKNGSFFIVCFIALGLSVFVMIFSLIIFIVHFRSL